MSSHWPVLLAILMVSAAVAFGIYTQGERQEKGKVESTIKALPTKYVPVISVKPVSPVYVPPVVIQPAAPASNSAARGLPPPPAFVAQKTANGVQPPAGKVAAVPAPPLNGGTDRDTIFNNLRMALIQKYGVQPSATNAGFTLFVDGARIDTNTSANWSINLYNDNKANPTIQTENFLIVLNMIAANFEFDLNAPSHNTAEGKIVKRPPSKLGRLSLTIDPALNNSISIQPIQPLKTGAPAPAAGNPNVNANPAVPKPPAAPAAPAVAAPAPPPQALQPPQAPKVKKIPDPQPANPAAPPKAPAIDQF